MSGEKIKVGVLGATGTVGQRFIELLVDHPWFELTEITASEANAGKTLLQAIEGRNRLPDSAAKKFGSKTVKSNSDNLDCRIVFSALDAAIAGDAEADLARRGYVVISKAKNHRMDSDVPLLVPEINSEQLSLIKTQKFSETGFITTDPNCSTTGLVMALAPLHQKFGVKKVLVTTMQALSGAGYPGVSSMDSVDNVIPFIGGEEDKVEREPNKIFGKVNNEKIELASIVVSATCNRVNVLDGHLESVSVEFENKPKSEQEIIDAFNSFNPIAELRLPSSPKQPVIYRTEPNRPQPRLDRDAGNGMSVVVGRLRKCSILDYKFLVLSHNTIRGAAGQAIQNAELLKVKGFL